MKAYWINAAEQTITEVEYAGLPDLQRMVGGYIECAKMWAGRDVLLVDEEGMLKGPKTWFALEGIERPLCGNAVVVGPEIGLTSSTYDPTISLAQLQREVRFLTEAQVRSWVAANRSDPAVVFTDLNTGESEVMMRTGPLYDEALGPKK